ncbi:hypothetical protein SteCoe_26068 [Stentor coeruleus]|uniref:Acid phosphatase n=1 Tax=Stentor coeruleus TaxID=5963 RepID=A0A1R2BDQ3_9CILI|nr:hypothetical protein SteCoe_26068 [Stentor coeruleus]
MKVRIEYAILGIVALAMVSIFFEFENRKGYVLPSQLRPYNVHMTNSDRETTFLWSIGIYPDYCTFSISSSNYTLTKYNQKLYFYYIYKVKIPNNIVHFSSSYSISCHLSQELSSRIFSLHHNIKNKNKILFLGDFSTSRIGDASNYQHTQTYKPNILTILENDYDQVSEIWHLGDIAYDLFSLKGLRGEEFLMDLEPFASKIPYIAVVGNHEIKSLFRDYQSLFADGLYFSRTIGQSKIIAISSEFDFYFMKPFAFPYKHGYFQYLKQKQVAWLKKTLEEVDRKVTPWVIVVAHKPLYCSQNEESSMIMQVCTIQARVMRDAYEDIFLKYEVDLGIFAHIHLYERTLPVKHHEIIGDYEDTKVFYNPKAPIYVINGVAGNLEGESIVFSITETPDPWTVLITENLGYGILTVHNFTHLEYRQYGFGYSQWDNAFIDLYPTKHLIDTFLIVKTSHI